MWFRNVGRGYAELWIGIWYSKFLDDFCRVVEVFLYAKRTPRIHCNTWRWKNGKTTWLTDWINMQSNTGDKDKKRQTLHFEGGGIGSSSKCLGFGVRRNILKVQTSNCKANRVVARHAPKNHHFFVNISRSWRRRAKMLDTRNVPRQISYMTVYSKVSLGLRKFVKLIKLHVFCNFSAFFCKYLAFLKA